MVQSKTNFKLTFPFSSQLKSLAQIILKQGDELRIVGGCVRDFLTNQKISDIDLACKYKPEQLIDILEANQIKFIPTGIKHGTITAIIDKHNFEITSLRKDVENYGRSAQVEFTDDFYSDAQRRDFTINALSIDFSNNLYDYFDGLNDLQNRLVKFIGNPEERIKEDFLRILRFFRFSCYYSDSINQEGFLAAIKFKDQINLLSADRIRNELIKIISCNNYIQLLKILSLMQQNQLLEAILISEYFDLTYLNNLLFLEKKLARKFNYQIKFAALIYSQKNHFQKIAKRLNLSNHDIIYIKSIINPQFVIDFDISERSLIGLMLEYEQDSIIDNFIMNLALMPLKKINDSMIEKILYIEKTLLTAVIPTFPINGNDLLAINIEPIKIGKMLKLGRNYWAENDFKIDAEEIINFISKNVNFY